MAASGPSDHWHQAVVLQPADKAEPKAAAADTLKAVKTDHTAESVEIATIVCTICRQAFCQDWVRGHSVCWKENCTKR